MGILIACLTTGKGSWAQVSDLISGADWKKVYLVTNEFGKNKFSHKKNFVFVTINLDDSLEIMRDKIIYDLKDLRGEIGFNDVALNFSSGSGKEHMAILSAILKLGVGLRLVDVKNKEVVNL